MALKFKTVQKNLWILTSFVLMTQVVFAENKDNLLQPVTLQAPTSEKKEFLDKTAISPSLELKAPTSQKNFMSASNSKKNDQKSSSTKSDNQLIQKKLVNTTNVSSAPVDSNLIPETPKLDTTEENENKLTLGMLDRTQQEILLLQSQLELDKLKQQLRNLTSSSNVSSPMQMSSSLLSYEKSEKNSNKKKILLMYKIKNTKYVRFQISEGYQLDLSEGETFPDGTVLLKIEESCVVLKDSSNRSIRLSIV